MRSGRLRRPTPAERALAATAAARRAQLQAVPPEPVRPRGWKRRIFAFALIAGGSWVGWRALAPLGPAEAAAPATISAPQGLEERALLAAGRRDGWRAVESRTLALNDTVAAVLMAAGVPADDARDAEQALASAGAPPALDGRLTVSLARGASFDSLQLAGLSWRTGPAGAVLLTRTADGGYRVRTAEEAVRMETAVAAGTIDGSLYSSAARAGADERIISEALSLFSRRLDFERDLSEGDPFRLVYDRQVTEDGRVLSSGALLYAEVDAADGPARFYRYERGGRVGWFDAFGRDMRGFLLRTPVDGARITSGFGLRRHPILGYTRMHQGIDFGAVTGAPVLAAGDGVVVEAGWKGGYGNWVRIRHANGWETGYGHLSGYARGLRPGATVRQGQVVAFVGSTGQSTGPHLHYEIWRDGERLNPLSVRPAQGVQLVGADLSAFEARRARIDEALAAGPAATAGQDDVRRAALRPTLAALPPTVRAG